MLKELNKEMSLESIEKLMDDTAEGIAYQEVILIPRLGAYGRKFLDCWRVRLRMRRRKRY